MTRARKPGVDRFWYFLVVVGAVVFFTYTDCVKFDSDEGEFLMKIVPVIGAIFGVDAWKSRKAAETPEAD